MSANVGFRILGAAAADQCGIVSNAGDVNGDGISDIVIGAQFADPPSGVDAGVVYVIFGRNIPGGAAAFGDIQLTTGTVTMPASVGFRILGASAGDLLGVSRTAGDVNGDGIGDIIMSAYMADSLNRLDAGVSYVVYGRNVPGGDVSFSDIQLSTDAMPTHIGYRIVGATAGDNSGGAGAAGDFNDDGIGDLIVSSGNADPITGADAGITYVIYGEDMRPTSKPSSQPSSQPSRQPSRQPSSQPSKQPVSIPTTQPSAQPSKQPSGQPSRQPTLQPSAQPSTVPSTQPTGEPSAQPSTQPYSQPSIQPSIQPSSQPSMQPIGQPTCKPSVQPTVQPTSEPTSQPSSQPSTSPTTQPFTQPTTTPSIQPTLQPTTQPSRQPTVDQTSQPSPQPSTQPSIQPSVQPSVQPKNLPSTQPSMQPSMQPSILPSIQPSSQPSTQPSMQPSKQLSTQPSTQPSALPSMQPSTEPSSQPSTQPSTSAQPSTQPSILPSMQLSIQPSAPPSTQPSNQPSTQPSIQSTSQPSTQPTMQPSTHPSVQQTMQPTTQPSTQPSVQPSAQPFMPPSAQPSTQPISQPSIQPSIIPTVQLSILPSTQPFTQPVVQPSSLPSTAPSLQPSAQTTAQPTMQPSISPTGQPLTSPTLIPSVSPTRRTGVWATILDKSVETNTLERIGSTLWLCGRRSTNNAESFCEHIESVYGTLLATYLFPWSAITSVISTDSVSNVVISGNNVRDDFVAAHIASCRISEAQFTCAAQMLSDYSITGGSEVPSVQKILYVGYYVEHPAITVFNPTANIISNYYYTIQRVKLITFTKALSPPAYIGSFVSGTCVGNSGSIYIFAGVVRSDSGSMNAMYLSPARGAIVNRVELVNAMALEYVNPDSFIAGGLQLSDGTGMHAYLVRVNTLYFSVLYGVRYRINIEGLSTRRALQAQLTTNSVVRSMVLVDTVLYIVVTTQSSLENSTCVLKTDATTGLIIKQVQLHASSASLSCTNIVISGLHLVVSCPYKENKNSNNNTVQVLLISMDYDLSMPRLTMGFRRYENNTFYAESILFHRTVIPMAVQKVDTLSTEYTFVTGAESSTISPTIIPTARPSIPSSSAPSGQPSSSPTAAPSVSPQPTSQPSSSGPTNTYKPTVKPTERPTEQPSPYITTRPTPQPTCSPTLQPTKPPTVGPSTKPSCAPTRAPTRAPSVQPTRYPSVRNTNTPSNLPTATLSVMPTAPNTVAKRQDQTHAITILGYAVAGLFGLWCLYQLNQLFKYLIQKVRADKILVAHMQKTDPSFQPRYPLLGTLLESFCPVDFEERVNPDTVLTNDIPSDDNSLSGLGAYIDGPASIIDLEANITNNSGSAAVDSDMSVSELSEYDSIVNDSQADDAQLTYDEGTLSADESVNSADASQELESRSEGDSVFSHEPAHSSDLSYKSAGTESYYNSNDSEVVFTISSGSQPVSDHAKGEGSVVGISADESVVRSQESDASDDEGGFSQTV